MFFSLGDPDPTSEKQMGLIFVHDIEEKVDPDPF